MVEKKVEKKQNKNRGPSKFKNFRIGKKGVMRYSQAQCYRKRGMWTKRTKRSLPQKKKDSTHVRTPKWEVKKVKTGTRMVYKKRLPRLYLTQRKRTLIKKKTKTPNKTTLKKGIKPGTVLILLAGRHKGRRVVFLKQLASGLLLVTGPYKISGCPLRRLNQIYCIVTKTKVNLTKYKVPEHLDDAYFARKELSRPKHTEGAIFATKRETYTVSDQRKQDQVAVDKVVIDAIKTHKDKKALFGYLKTSWSLRNGEFPHQMRF